MNNERPVVCRNGIALGGFPLISLAVVLRSLAGFGLVGAYIIIWAVAGERSVNTTIGLIETLGIVPVVLIGLPSIVIAVGLMRKASWAAWAAIIHDCIILPLFVGFYLPPFAYNPTNLIWSGTILALGIAFLIEAYFLLDFFCERKLVWTIIITVALLSFGLGIAKALLTGGYTLPRT